MSEWERERARAREHAPHTTQHNTHDKKNPGRQHKLYITQNIVYIKKKMIPGKIVHARVICLLSMIWKDKSGKNPRKIKFPFMVDLRRRPRYTPGTRPSPCTCPTFGNLRTCREPSGSTGGESPGSVRSSGARCYPPTRAFVLQHKKAWVVCAHSG